MSPSVMELGAGGVGESQDALRIKSAVPTNVSQVETSSVALRLAAAFGQPSRFVDNWREIGQMNLAFKVVFTYLRLQYYAGNR
jgi:hypothetical protein